MLKLGWIHAQVLRNEVYTWRYETKEEDAVVGPAQTSKYDESKSCM
jgi:hypothetical protein